MPKVNLTADERNRSQRQNKINRNGRALERILATVKHKVGYDKIRAETGYSQATIVKIINRPLEARVEQLLAVSDICGIDLVIEERKDVIYESKCS